MTTINKEEIQSFQTYLRNGGMFKFKPLHLFNPIRIEYIVEKIKHHFNLKNSKVNFR